MTATIARADAAGVAEAATLAETAGLFRDYAAELGVDLSYQNFEAELAGLPGAYGPPSGALLLAREEGVAVGCVALRGAGGVAELKRLYVAPIGRGQGLGERLVRSALAEAVLLGHHTVRLDTLPGMAAAQALYRKLGFVPTEPYYAGAPGGTLYFALALVAAA